MTRGQTDRSPRGPSLPRPTMLAAGDGVQVATYSIRSGASGRPLLAAHATGLCAATLAPMVTHLPAAVPVVLFDERGHGASGRPGSGSFAWQGFADDALAVCDGLKLSRPLGFGHSCGGAALLLAELARPGTFAGLYLYEPVVRPAASSGSLPSPDNPLVLAARRRRPRFASRQQAMANFATKAPFAGIDPDALAAYVTHGLRASAEGDLELCCAREDEAAVYAASGAHGAFERLGDVRCPVTIACGSEPGTLDATVLAPAARRIPGAELVVLPGLGHFGPLQDPAAVARSLIGSATWAACMA